VVRLQRSRTNQSLPSGSVLSAIVNSAEGLTSCRYDCSRPRLDSLFFRLGNRRGGVEDVTALRVQRIPVGPSKQADLWALCVFLC